MIGITPSPSFLKMKEALSQFHPEASTAVHLEPSGDSAVAQFPDHRNTVGFLPLITCPGATYGPGGCTVDCYGRNGRALGRGCVSRLARNTHVLFRLCTRGAVRKLTDEFLRLMDDAHARYERRIARASRREFRHLRRGSLWRWNWNGDLVHAVQAEALVRATRARPHLQTWIYTRSFEFLDFLDPPPENLVVWLSSDRVNRDRVAEVNQAYPWAKVADLATEEKESGVICPKLRYQNGVPVLANEGACSRCRICTQDLTRVTTVIFPVKRYLSRRPPPQDLLTILT